MKTDLTTKDEQLKQAQQQAADAQAAAAKAEQDATAQEQATSQNMSAVSTLQSTVTDLKANQATLVTNMSDESAKIKKEIENPDVIHFKGATISFSGSFLAGETVWRAGRHGRRHQHPVHQRAPAILGQCSDQRVLAAPAVSRACYSERSASCPDWTMTGYYEADWLGAGITSNNNQSNSYSMRQRQLWADARENGGWDFSGGQGWSLVTETTKGLTRGTEILPATIDPQYTPASCGRANTASALRRISPTSSSSALRLRTRRL